MSHEWITYVMADERLTLEGRKIRRLLEDNQLNGGIYPYQRWISLVTGRQLRKHQKSKGSHHEAQVLYLLGNIFLK
jgi:hypothetical protein